MSAGTKEDDPDDCAATDDDLADPRADDPILRESTRVSAAVGILGQTSIDPKVLEEWLGPQGLQHRMPYMAVGEASIEDALRNYDRHHAMFVKFSPITHVSSDDPPLMMVYAADASLPAKNASHAIHHPLMGRRRMIRVPSTVMRHVRGTSGRGCRHPRRHTLLLRPSTTGPRRQAVATHAAGRGRIVARAGDPSPPA